MEIIRPPNTAHHAANYITLRATFLSNVAQMILVRVRSATVAVREWNSLTRLWCTMRAWFEGKGNLRRRVSKLWHCAANTESRLSGSESMPFVLHYSVQSNTASGIRVSRRVSSIDILQYHGCVYNTSLQRQRVLFENARLLIN